MNKTDRPVSMLSGLLLSLMTVIPGSTTLAQHGPAPDSPRMIGIESIRRIASVSPGELEAVLEEVISPQMWGHLGKEGVHDLVSELRTFLKGAKPSGARPTGEYSARLNFSRDSEVIPVDLTVESKPPHRLTEISLDLSGASHIAESDIPGAIEQFLEKQAADGTFSGAVLVARNGKPIVAKAIGLADRKTGRANTLDTPINLASMNKMFTGVAIGQLVSQGKLDWSDTVGEHLPDYPDEIVRDKVTIHQLLTHTSGVPSYWNDAFEAKKNEIRTLEDFLSTFVNEPLMFEPGTEARYSNGGPVILGLIIEKISGMSYYDYIRKHIYAPAGMDHADHYLMTDESAGFAIGYHRESPDGPFVPNTDILGLRGSAAGGGYASANDLLAFARALDSETLLDRKWLEELWKPRNGEDRGFGYGYLWGTGIEGGKRWVGHNGGAPGVSADFRHFPDAGYTVIVLGNQSGVAMPVSSWIVDLIARQTADPVASN